MIEEELSPLMLRFKLFVDANLRRTQIKRCSELQHNDAQEWMSLSSSPHFSEVLSINYPSDVNSNTKFCGGEDASLVPGVRIDFVFNLNCVIVSQMTKESVG